MKRNRRSSNLRYQTLLQLLRTADSLWAASRVFFARWDLGPSQFNVLNLLSDQPNGLSQIELGRLLITHRSNVTGLVDRLERRGLVGRRDSATDRRAYRVVLTDAGHKLLARILPEYYRVADKIWTGFSVERAATLASDLERLTFNAQEIINPKEQL
jgi:DNA-binding MarR family transcriptional regulator